MTQAEILRLLGKRKPRASHITTARLRLLSALGNKVKPRNRATLYIPDSPTDSSYEAIDKEMLSRHLSELHGQIFYIAGPSRDG